MGEKERSEGWDWTSESTRLIGVKWFRRIFIYDCRDRKHVEMETVDHLREWPYLRNHKGLDTWTSGTILP